MAIEDTTDKAAFLDEWGEPVTIGGVESLAVVDYEESPAFPPEGRGRSGAGLADWAVFTVDKAVVPKPSYRLEIVHEGVTWRVARWAGAGGFWELTCSSDERLGR